MKTTKAPSTPKDDYAYISVVERKDLTYSDNIYIWLAADPNCMLVRRERLSFFLQQVKAGESDEFILEERNA